MLCRRRILRNSFLPAAVALICRWLDNQIIGEGSSINNAYSTKHRWWDSAKENNRPREMSRRNGELMTWSRKANRLLRVEIGSSNGGEDCWVPKAYPDINCVCTQPSMDDEKRLSLNAWVDKDKKRVVFAEADSDFVDVLFSILTLSLGTIIKLLSNNFGLGCIDNPYDSIKQLNDQHFSTKACKMLLSPCSAAAEHCEKLQLNIYGPSEFYRCKMDDCILHTRCYYSSVWQTRCYHCVKFMDEVV